MVVPPQQLSADALTAIIEDFLSRQTQENVVDHQEWLGLIEQVRTQLFSQELLLTWDDESQTINIQLAQDVPSPD